MLVRMFPFSFSLFVFISTQTNVYTHRVKIQERPELPVHYHLLHVILQWHHFVEEHTVFYLRTKSSYSVVLYLLQVEKFSSKRYSTLHRG